MTRAAVEPNTPAAGGSTRRRAGMRSLLVVAGLAALAARLGTGPILEALAGLDAATVLTALALGAIATAASALRWRAVSRAVGDTMPIGAAWAGIYRATLLNSVLPGGFLGDVDRAVGAHRRARDAHQDPRRAARVVVLERAAGQVTVFAAALAVVVATAPPLLPALLPAPTALALLAATGGGLGTLAALAGSRRARTAVAARVGPVARQVAALGGELRGALRPRTAAVVLASSLIGFASLVATFALAADVVGAALPPSQLLALCTVGLVAMAVPINLGGWGPRELATAAGFAAAGHGAPTGLAVAVLYGVLSLLGALPGAVVLALDTRTATRTGARGRPRAAGTGPPADTSHHAPHPRLPHSERTRA